MIVQTQDLEPLLGDPSLILADVRSYKEYSEGHIPGAVNLDLFAFHWVDTSSRGIEAFDSQAMTLFSFLGAGPGKRIVFYDGMSGMVAARGVWMSEYLSAGSASLLDGGIAKWTAEGRRLEEKPNGFAPSKFEGRPDPGLIAGFEYVRDNLERLTIIDARSPGEYAGDEVRAARAGHIPGAVNIDWSQNLTADGTFKDVDGLAKLYEIPKDAEIVTYCQGAYRAAHSFVALRRLGFENVRVYLGSWGEWGNRSGLPAER